MTDAERKQFINEYCRNVGNIKIKCDDCKFVEDCVDYGWEGCKKFTLAPSTPMTNEEWVRQCTTEQLIEFLEKITDPHVGYLDGYWQEWLKQPHTSKE